MIYLGNGIYSESGYDTLSHYGIKGQHWGERNGPPYPLKTSQMSASEKRGPSFGDERNVKNTTADKINKTKRIVAAATLNPFAIASLINDSKASRQMKNYLATRPRTCKVDEETGLFLKSNNYSKIEDCNRVNIEKKSSSSGVRSNCMLCTAAYDLRRRGYEVIANYAVKGYQTEEFQKWYPKAKVKKESMLVEKDGHYYWSEEAKTDFKAAHAKFKENAFDKVKQMEKTNGARGNVMVTWLFGGGHSMAYEIENGSFVIYDAQSGKRYDKNDFNSILNMSCQVEWMRLDNVKPDIKQMKKDEVIL